MLCFQVKILDLSHNYFKTVPKGLSILPNLQRLYLSQNQVSELTKYTLNLSSLLTLDLTNNNFRSWQRIQPASLNLTKSIVELDLSHNPIRNLSSVSYLKSNSLQILKLKNCSISQVPNSFLLELTTLKDFVISDNEYLKSFKHVASLSIEKVEITNCNLDEVNLSALRNLKLANLRGNRINKIMPGHFRNNKLEYLDLSDNTIKIINHDAFFNIPSLMSLNLSMNVFIDLHQNTFLRNEQLKTLLISRTYLQKMVQFDVPSLTYLDLSINEIQDFNSESLISMPSLQHLILSNNLISKLPSKIVSNSLQYLDVSNCRILKIEADSLVFLANLEFLNLAGNKLTSLHKNYLPKYLTGVRLDNNLWRCECYSKEFKEQHDYFINPPGGLTSPDTLTCNSPENVSGLTWDQACGRTWYELGHGYVRSEKLWMYIISMILAMSVIFCTTMCIRRMYRVKLLREQAERQRMVAEAQERISRLRREQQRQIEAQQNAPDPRELVRPPSYHEAIRMPRLDGSCHSLAASRTSLAASRPSLAASNPDVSKRSKGTKRRPKTDNERRRRSRRRRRHTGGSSEEATDTPTTNDNEIQIDCEDPPESDDDSNIRRSLVCLTHRSINYQSEEEEVSVVQSNERG